MRKHKRNMLKLKEEIAQARLERKRRVVEQTLIVNNALKELPEEQQEMFNELLKESVKQEQEELQVKSFEKKIKKMQRKAAREARIRASKMSYLDHMNFLRRLKKANEQ